MDALRRQLGLGCCLVLLISGGCRSPLGFVAKTATRNAIDVPTSHVVVVPPDSEVPSEGKTTTGRVVPKPGSPLAMPSREEAFAQILGDLESLGAENPQAQRELLAQLKEADPDHWDLLVRRFRSDLAYHKQIKGTDANDSGRDGVMIARQESAAGPKSERSRDETVYDAIPSGSSVYASQASNDSTNTSRKESTRERTAARDAGRDEMRDYETVRERSDSMATSSRDQYESYPKTREPQRFDKARDRDRRAYESRDRETHYQDSDRRSALRDSQRDEARLTPRRRDERVQQVSASLVSDDPHHQRRDFQAKDYNPRRHQWKQTLEQAIADLRRDVVEDPQSTGEAYQHARLRLLQLVAGDLDQASRHVPGLTPTEQDYWAKQLYAIDALLDVQRQSEPGRRAAAASMHLSSAQAKLSQLSNLSIRNATFCDKIYGYGAYDARKENKFKPGEEVSIYAEVENFRSVSTEDGYHTVIGTSYQVLDQRGNRVAGREFPNVEDYCLSRRRDFNLQYDMTLPERIYPDDYQFELTLTDHLGQKIGRTTLDFTIVDGPAE